MPRIRAANIAEHKAQMREQLLDAAQSLFRQQGYEETSLGDVAASVGVGRTTVYEYFADKDDLLATLVEETLPQKVDEMVASIPPGLAPVERFVALAVRMVEFIVSDPTLGLILHREVQKMGEAAQERVAVAHRGLSAEFGAIFRAGLASGELKSLPMRLAGHFTQDLIMSAARAVIESDEPARDLPVITEALADVLLDGFAR